MKKLRLWLIKKLKAVPVEEYDFAFMASMEALDNQISKTMELEELLFNRKLLAGETEDQASGLRKLADGSAS